LTWKRKPAAKISISFKLAELRLSGFHRKPNRDLFGMLSLASSSHLPLKVSSGANDAAGRKGLTEAQHAEAP